MWFLEFISAKFNKTGCISILNFSFFSMKRTHKRFNELAAAPPNPHTQPCISVGFPGYLVI